MDKNIEDKLAEASDLKGVTANYYAEIQRLQAENAFEKDLIASLDRKLKIKSIWSKIWGVLALLLSLLLTITNI